MTTQEPCLTWSILQSPAGLRPRQKSSAAAFLQIGRSSNKLTLPSDLHPQRAGRMRQGIAKMKCHTVVVGASSGVGLATARKFASRGDRLTLIARSEAGLLEAAALIDGAPRVLALDMRDGEGAAKAFLHDTIDHVVLTAVTGEMSRLAPLGELTAVQIEASFDKLRGYLSFLQAVLPNLAERASITMLCGLSAVRPGKKGFALLSAESASIAGLGKALSVELAPRRVNVLMCGVLNTPIHGEDRSALRAWAEESLPARHLGEPEDAADYIFSLANNRYATGDVAILDGGLALI